MTSDNERGTIPKMKNPRKFNAHRAVRETLRLDYQPLMKELIQRRASRDGEYGEVLSDKIAAEMCGVSERQVRKARREGMDPYLADHMCTVGLGMPPILLFGDAWLTEEALHAEDLYDKTLVPSDLDDPAAPIRLTA